MPEFDGADVRRMVAAVRHEWEVLDWQRATEGTDFVALLTCATPSDEREAVLKACTFLEPEQFRPEPRVLDLVADRTSIPIPAPIGTGGGRGSEHPPFFLMDHLEGEQVGGPADLAAGALARLAREAGENLARLHDVADWGACGSVRCAEDADVEGPVGLGVANAHDSWRAWLRDMAEASLDNLDGRFVDLEPALRDAVERRLDDVSEPDRVAILHGDYRYGNLLVDADSGETRGVVDWGNHVTGDPANDLVSTENYLSGWAGVDSDLRARVRSNLREGYRSRRALDLDPAARRAYLLVTWLVPLRWFDLWYGDATEAERETIERRHREALSSLR